MSKKKAVFNKLLGGGIDVDSFVISVKTDNTGTSNNDQFGLYFTTAGSPTTLFDVDWGDGNSDLAQTGNIVHTYASAGTYTVTLTGESGSFLSSDSGENQKIIDIINWGFYQWNLAFTFRGMNMTGNWSAIDAPNLSNVTDMATAFANNPQNADFSGWDLTNILGLTNCFFNNDSFRGDGLDTWDLTNATTISMLTASTGLSTANYDALLLAWDALGVYAYSGNVNFGGSKYTSGGAVETARTNLIAKWGSITDGGAV